MLHKHPQAVNLPRSCKVKGTRPAYARLPHAEDRSRVTSINKRCCGADVIIAEETTTKVGFYNSYNTITRYGRLAHTLRQLIWLNLQHSLLLSSMYSTEAHVYSTR